jgi:hypothetical protein
VKRTAISLAIAACIFSIGFWTGKNLTEREVQRAQIAKFATPEEVTALREKLKEPIKKRSEEILRNQRTR